MADLRSIDKTGVDKSRYVAQNKDMENDGGTEMTKRIQRVCGHKEMVWMPGNGGDEEFLKGTLCSKCWEDAKTQLYGID